MRFNRLIPLIILLVVLFGLNMHDEKVDYINGEHKNQVDECNKDQKARTVVGNEAKIIDIQGPIFKHGPLPEQIIEKISGISYKENDNIYIEDLAFVQVTHWGFDDKEHYGELIVNTNVAQGVVEIFKELYEAKFPIEKIRLIDEYGADDNLSMQDNNTSAFCYREIAGSKGILSNHGYGIAIDINPVQNPYIKDDIILPQNGEDYRDRDNIRQGMIIKDGSCYNAFKQRGWTWGGEWQSLKDYQHFEIDLIMETTPQ